MNFFKLQTVNGNPIIVNLERVVWIDKCQPRKLPEFDKEHSAICLEDGTVHRVTVTMEEWEKHVVKSFPTSMEFVEVPAGEVATYSRQDTPDFQIPESGLIPVPDSSNPAIARIKSRVDRQENGGQK